MININRPQRTSDAARDRRRGDRVGMLFAALHESENDVVDGARSRQRIADPECPLFGRFRG